MWPVYLWQSMTRTQQRFCVGMFVYGSGRTFCADYYGGDGEMLLVQRVPYSMCCGVLCTIPLFTAWELFKLANRVEVKLTGKDPTKYPHMYSCGTLATNPRLLW